MLEAPFLPTGVTADGDIVVTSVSIELDGALGCGCNVLHYVEDLGGGRWAAVCPCGASKPTVSDVVEVGDGD